MRFRSNPILLKVILLNLMIVGLHYLYDWFPFNLIRQVSGTNESVCQHMKIGYFAYIILVVIEYLIVRKNIYSKNKFVYSRLFTASYYLFVVMVIYIIGALVFGQFQSITADIIFANIALFLTSLFSFFVEKHVKESQPFLEFRLVIHFFFLENEIGKSQEII